MEKEKEEEDGSDESMWEDIDPYGDEWEEEDVFEDDEELDEEKRKEKEERMMKEEEMPEIPAVKVFRPGIDKLGKDEVLDYTSKSYLMFHRFLPEWPCLSIDVVLDKEGYGRKKFPHTVYAITGTQAQAGEKNQLLALKMAHLAKTQNDSDDEFDEEENEAKGEEEEDDDDSDPVLEHKKYGFGPAFNRIRCMPTNPSRYVASWHEDGKFCFWDVSQHLQSLDKFVKELPKPLVQTLPFDAEGFALDWNPSRDGRLAVGDIKKNIYLINYQESKWSSDRSPYVGHEKSVEDIQWSPTETEVFASCSTDQTIKVWDTRQKKAPGVSVVAHNSDVNVMSWNPKVGHLLLSGSDDGSFRIWDLRNFKSDSPAAHFSWHQKPITSVQWDPNDDSVLAVSSADDTVTIWDLSLERDPEEHAKLGGADDFPPQLLFIHGGQHNIKEIRWHPQIPGALITTAEDGFNVFKPDV
eukprot:TRINITY_DN403_c0_g1_i1.p1 TRINITY_DN403_c0_g1~~TRINITY_DN403_c0_g1_i1.p1  ORF type:complete len:525 (-),score=155.02 TRINITY_DN403_c0_g1_i1:50-1447(-)